jgi:dTMP kinase
MHLENHLTPYQSQNNSFFISFEGIEGSGKTTQIKLLAEYLKTKGFRVLTLREPGGTDFGESLRSAILGSNTPIHPLAEANLFAAGRAQLLFEKVLPFLETKNSVVLVDRYIDSSMAYQGNARGLGLQTILDIHKQAPLNTVPNLTFYLEISLELSHERQAARGSEKDYFEKENHKFYQSLIDGFELCAKAFPERIKTIKAHKEIETIKEMIIEQTELILC